MNSTHSEITQSEEAFIKKTALDGNGQTDMTDCWGLNGTSLNDADAYMQGSRVSMVTRDEEGCPILINFESLYNESIGNPWFVMRTLMPAKNASFSSWWASTRKSMNKIFEKAIQKRKDLD